MTTATIEAPVAADPKPTKTKQSWYKVVGTNMESIHGGTYIYTLGEWTEDRSPLGRYRDSYYLTSNPIEFYKPGCRVFLCEVFDRKDDPRQSRSSSQSEWGRIRLTHEVTDTVLPPWIAPLEAEAHALVGRILAARNAGGDTPERSRWRVFDTSDQAEMSRVIHWPDVYLAEIRQRISTGRDGADGVVKTLAEWAMKRLGHQGYSHPFLVDFTFYLKLRLAEHADEWMPVVARHVRERMDVWLAGYQLLGHYDGIFYVYRSDA